MAPILRWDNFFVMAVTWHWLDVAPQKKKRDVRKKKKRDVRKRPKLKERITFSEGLCIFWMSSEKNICRTGSSRDRLSLEEQSGSWENEEWMVVEKESTGEYLKAAPNGAEALRNMPTLPWKREGTEERNHWEYVAQGRERHWQLIYLCWRAGESLWVQSWHSSLSWPLLLGPRTPYAKLGVMDLPSTRGPSYVFHSQIRIYRCR